MRLCIFFKRKDKLPSHGFFVSGGWWLASENKCVPRGTRQTLKTFQEKKKQRGRFLSEKSLKDNFLGLVLYNELYRELKRERER